MAVKYQDYYKTLNVDRKASQEEIQKAYRRLARKYHPDINSEADAADRFKEITEAYEVLRDPEKRKRYDELGANWQAGQDFTPPPGWEHVNVRFGQGGRGGAADFGDFSDFFSTLFGDVGVKGFGGGLNDLFNSEAFRGAGRGTGGFGAHPGAGFGHGHGPRRDPERRGQDVEAEIEISLDDAYQGRKRTIALERPVNQPDGRITYERKNYDVTIPRGVTNGSKIRLSRQGGKGAGGASDGDLFLKVRIRPDSRFQVEGHDLRTTVPVAPWEAALGAQVSVPTPNGSVSMKIPAGTQGGRVMRLRGLGLPRRKGAAGDILAMVQIAIPEHLTPRERELYETLARESTFRPRR